MHSSTGRWQLGLALALTTAVCWGLLPVALKITLGAMDAFTLTWYRFTTAGIALGAYLAWRRRLPVPPTLTRRGWALLAAAICGLVANYVLYLLSLEQTSPTVAQVLIQLAPVFLLFGGLLFFRERFAPAQWFGLAVLLSGLGLFFHDRLAEMFSTSTPLGLGVVLMLGAALTWAAYALAQKLLLAQLASEQVLFLVYCAAAVLLLPPAHLAQAMQLDSLQLGMLAFCCANTVVAYGCFAEALAHWEVSRVSAVVTLAPLITLVAMQVAGWLWPEFGHAERLNGLSVLGALLVVSGSMTTALAARGAGPPAAGAPLD